MLTSPTSLLKVDLKLAVVPDPLTTSPKTRLLDAIAQMSGCRSSCQFIGVPDGDRYFYDRLAQLYSDVRSSCVVVVDGQEILGIVTERDVVNLSAQQAISDTLTVGEVMATSVITQSVDDLTDFFSTVNLLRQHHIRHLPVVDAQQRLMGLVTHESLRHLSRPIDLLRLRLAEEVMARQVVCAEPQETLLAIAQKMSNHRVSCVVLVRTTPDRDPSLPMPVGIVTERDLVQFKALGLVLAECLAETVMSTPVFSIGPEESLWAVQEAMDRQLIRRLVVVGEHQELLGIVTQSSLLQALNPLELYKLAAALEDKVVQLELEKMRLMEGRAAELEREVQSRTLVLQMAAKRDKLLAELAMQIRSSLSLQEILTTTVGHIRQVLGCDRVNIWQFLDSGSSLVVAESTASRVSLLGEQVNDTCFAAVMGKWAQPGRVRVVPDIYTTPMADCHRDMLIRLRTRSKILVPLLCGENLWGMLNVSESDFPRTWQPEDVELLQALAVQLAIAIQQATTYEQLQAELKERQSAEASLQESEERYATLAAAVPVGIFRADLLGQCTYVNDRWCQMTGLQPREALGNQWQRVIYPADRDQVLREWMRAAHTNQPVELEFRYQTPSGKVIWVYVQSVPESNDAGIVVGHVGTVTDISDRKQAETALQNLIAGTAATTGKDFFPALVTHIAAALNVSYAVVTALGKDQRLQTLAFWANGQLQSPFSYQASATPCEQTLEQGRFFCACQLADRFPLGPEGDLDLAALGAESYLGVALHNSQGEAIGNLCVLDQEPIHDPERAEQLLTVFVARAAAELERQQASTQLEKLNQELEAKVAERTAELREREQFLQTVLDTFPLSVFWKDRDCVMRGCNQEFVRVVGVDSSEDVIGKGTLDLSMTAEEAAAYQADDRRVMASGQAELGIEESLTRPDGELRWLETNKLPLRDGDGNVVGIVGTFQDITARKEAEMKLRAQAEQERLLSGITQRVRSSLNLSEILNATVIELHQVLESDRMLVYRVFENGTGAAIAEAVSTGYPPLLERVFPEEVFPAESYSRYGEGRVFVLNDVVMESDRVAPCLADFLGEIQVQAKLVVPIIQHNRLWGLLIAHQCDRPRHWKLREIKLLQQTAAHIAIAIQQVHLFEQLQAELRERQQAQQQLTERNQQLAVSNEQLARATRLKDEFLANMSHELRTPLNAILGMAEGLQDQVFGPVTPPQLKALKTIERSGLHLLELINDILDVAKIEAGQIELHCTPTPVESLCQSSLTFIRQQAKKKQIQVRLWVPPNLPDLMVDERRIRQVLLNLLNNAVKFTPAEGAITITVAHRDTLTLALPASLADLNPGQIIPPSPRLPMPNGAQPALHIAITDTGIGIAPDNLSRLFQPFIQIDSALNRQYNGTGLGLALVKRIVELHGGQVGVVSEVGTGSCFMVSLPCAAPRGDRYTFGDLGQGFLGTLQEDPTGEHSPVILLAEDNEANISTISSYLGAKGYQMKIAKDGNEAIAQALAESPDLILMDIQMPGMDGLAAIQQIRQQEHLQSVPIIALTALVMEGDREQCLAAGATEYLSKPVKLKQLVTLIQHLLAPSQSSPGETLDTPSEPSE